MWDTGHRDALAAPNLAAGQHDVQRASRHLGVSVEQLVEVAQAEQQQRVRVARFRSRYWRRSGETPNASSPGRVCETFGCFGTSRRPSVC